MKHAHAIVGALTTVTALLVSAACSDRGPAGPADEMGEFQIHAAVNRPTIATLVVEVTAPDLSDPLIFNFALGEDGVASGTIVVPAGARRTIEVRAFDVGGIQTHEGRITVNIRPGPNPLVRITLRPLTGDQPVEIVLGSFTVTVEPSQAIVFVGQSLQLEATVTDVDGTVVGGVNDVVWATALPAVATVDGAGLVTARPFIPPGSAAAIVATFGGVGSQAVIQVVEVAVTSSALEGMRPALDGVFSPPVRSLPAQELTGDVVFVGRGCPAGSVGPGVPDDPYLGDPAGKIALVERGGCFFTLKAARAQAAGAIGVIIYNNVGDDLVLMGRGTDDVIVVPTVSVQLSTGNLLRAGTPPVTGRLFVIIPAAPAPRVGNVLTGDAAPLGPRRYRPPVARDFQRVIR